MTDVYRVVIDADDDNAMIYAVQPDPLAFRKVHVHLVNVVMGLLWHDWSRETSVIHQVGLGIFE